MFDVVIVEGDLEISIVSALFKACDIEFRRNEVINKRGIEKFWGAAPRLNQAARHKSIFGLADLERHACAPALLKEKLGACPRANFVLRLSVRMSESWLMADQAEIARFLGISRAMVPDSPESLDNPKLSLVNLARGSRVRRIRDGVVPEAGSQRAVGIEYLRLLSEFAEEHWDPHRASLHSPSLAKAIQRLDQFRHQH